MPTLRQSFLPVASFALVSAAALAILVDVAHAQEDGAPVRYGTDPGFAGEGPQVLSYRAAKDAPAPVGEIEHRVRAGETVYAIGRLYDVHPGSIIQKNLLDAPYQLRIGQALLIPVRPEQRLRAEPQLIPASRQSVREIEPIYTDTSTSRFELDRTYIVQPGDTLYSLSRRFGMSVTDLAAANRLARPYIISIDQRLVIPGAGQPQYRSQPQQQIASATSRRMPDPSTLDRKLVEETLAGPSLPELDPSSPFAWPVRGPVLVQYGDIQDGAASDGINIAAPIGAPVRAAADGEVVYRGSELDGYGNLLLVKHASGWVSAYAHTDAILVRKGDLVRQGQVIAKVGRSGSVDRPQLHFQLRRDLQPLDPLIAMNGGTSQQTLTAAGLR